MKQILFLTDFSNNSMDAIDYALQLFSGSTCKFYVLHVELSNSYLSDDLMLSGQDSIYNALVKKPKSKLKHLIETLEKKARNEDFSFEAIIDHDVFIDAITQIIETKHIDLIVMGTNGASGVKEVVFGSNTINVIRHITCPTLVIPEGFKYKTPQNILLPLGVFDSIGCKSFMEALKFSTRFGKKLHIARVKEGKKDTVEEKNDTENIPKLVKEMDYEYHVISDVPMQHVVHSYAQVHHIDLLTLLVQKESFLKRLFSESSTTKITNKIKLPLIVFHS